ncbi:hypothetical protein LEP1GSC133_1524 [Leptospira borgpetersenii serovar Pomona str. 200901868]|uniref:Uncharacterized protein n=1 Tax=Leptospira borgpetersenii serovar Pomona str. 200901868 TaxID=1192866 RepID=M6W7Z0_LEPBO|nr:hypothetical protein LEP1GSC133_1524 [Leptospira borgpetersenii serovar Pomona str. 200901868]
MTPRTIYRRNWEILEFFSCTKFPKTIKLQKNADPADQQYG